MGLAYSGTRLSVQMLVLAALTVVLFAAARYIPVFGFLVSLLAPTPLVLVALRHRLVQGLLVLGFSTLSLALLLGILQSTLFLAEYGVMALAMAEGLRRGWAVERTILVSTAVPAVAGGIVLVALLWSTDLSTLKQHFEEDLNQALQQLATEQDMTGAALRTYIH